MSRPSNPVHVPILCYVTDSRSLVGAHPSNTLKILQQKITVAAAAGIDWIQIREKNLSAKECSVLTCEAVRLAASSLPRATTEASASARSEKIGRAHV